MEDDYSDIAERYVDPDEEVVENLPVFTSFVRCPDCSEKLGVVDVWSLRPDLEDPNLDDPFWWKTVHQIRPWDPDWVLGVHTSSACERRSRVLH